MKFKVLIVKFIIEDKTQQIMQEAPLFRSGFLWKFSSPPSAAAEPSEQPAVSENQTEESKSDFGSNKTFPVFAVVISVIGIAALAAAIVVMIILLVRKKKK